MEPTTDPPNDTITHPDGHIETRAQIEAWALELWGHISPSFRVVADLMSTKIPGVVEAKYSDGSRPVTAGDRVPVRIPSMVEPLMGFGRSAFAAGADIVGTVLFRALGVPTGDQVAYLVELLEDARRAATPDGLVGLLAQAMHKRPPPCFTCQGTGHHPGPKKPDEESRPPRMRAIALTDQEAQIIAAWRVVESVSTEYDTLVAGDHEREDELVANVLDRAEAGMVALEVSMSTVQDCAARVVQRERDRSRKRATEVEEDDELTARGRAKLEAAGIVPPVVSTDESGGD